MTPEREMRWTTSLSWTNWRAGEPNNVNEHGVRQLWLEGWQDVSAGGGYYFLIENEGFAGFGDGGSGADAWYTLDVTVTDVIAPQVVGFTRLPASGESPPLG